MVRAASARSVSYRLVIILLKPELCVQELEQGRSNLKVTLLGALVFLAAHSFEKAYACVLKYCLLGSNLLPAWEGI